MQQLIFFIQKYKYFLYFLLLEIIAFTLLVNNHSFHKSKFINSANAITGGVYKRTSNLSDYLNLKNRNQQLIDENAALKNQLETIKFLSDSIKLFEINDSIHQQKYQYIPVKIINNSYHKQFNFLTIDKGLNHNVTKEMAVINSFGVLGITEKSGNNYTLVRSILNKDIKINARFKNNFHYGSLQWNGKDYNIVQLTDIPREAVYKIGDTIVSGEKSTIFPEGIPIGKIKSLPKDSKNNNSIDIELFNDMSNLRNAYVIINLDKKEIKEVENLINE